MKLEVEVEMHGARDFYECVESGSQPVHAPCPMWREPRVGQAPRLIKNML